MPRLGPPTPLFFATYATVSAARLASASGNPSMLAGGARERVRLRVRRPGHGGGFCRTTQNNQPADFHLTRASPPAGPLPGIPSQRPNAS